MVLLVESSKTNLDFISLCKKDSKTTHKRTPLQPMDSLPEFIELLHNEGDTSLRCIVTGDETWIHHYAPENKRQSMEWKHLTSPVKNKIKT
jgi:hypothetical protein